MKVTKSAGGVVLNPKGEVLVVSQSGNSWSLPKGHLDEGESELEAAQREILEESGVRELTLVKELGAYKRPKIGLNGGDDRTEIKHITLFLFRTTQMDLKPSDPTNPEARWVEKSRVAELLTHAKDKEFYLKALKEMLS